MCVVNAVVEFLTYCLQHRQATPKCASQNIKFKNLKTYFFCKKTKVFQP